MVHRYIIDDSARVSPGNNQRHLADVPIENIVSALDQFIGVDTKAIQIAMLYGDLCVLGSVSIVEKTPSPYPIIIVTQNRITKNVV